MRAVQVVARFYRSSCPRCVSSTVVCVFSIFHAFLALFACALSLLVFRGVTTAALFYVLPQPGKKSSVHFWQTGRVLPSLVCRQTYLRQVYLSIFVACFSFFRCPSCFGADTFDALFPLAGFCAFALLCWSNPPPPLPPLSSDSIYPRVLKRCGPCCRFSLRLLAISRRKQCGSLF